MNVVVVAGDLEALGPHVEALQNLTEQRPRIALGSKGGPGCRWETPLDKTGRPIEFRTLDPGNLRTTPDSSVRRRAAMRARRLLLRGLAPIVGNQGRLRLGMKFDQWFRQTIRAADAVVLADAAAQASRGVVMTFSPGVHLFTGKEAFADLARWARSEAMSTALARSLAPGERNVAELPALVQAIQRLASGSTMDEAPEPRVQRRLASRLLTVGRRLLRAGRHRDALTLTCAVEELPWLEPGSSGMTATRLSAGITEHGGGTAGIASATTSALAAAQHALDDGANDHAVDLITVALGLLFHRDLHADAHASPLVDEPREFLTPLYTAPVAALLAPARARDRAAERTRAHQRRRVVVLPGGYSRFATPVIETLREAPGTEVSVLDLPARNRAFTWLGIDPMMVEERLRLAGGDPPSVQADAVRELAGADVVFADWGDKGAAWASWHVPARTRLVVRIHSMDALSPWIHLMDWSRVDDVIFVGAHIRDVVRESLGDRLAGVDVHVVPNVVDLERFRLSRADDAEHTLVMVGWNKKVKDPLWSVEVLAELRRSDPRWRLLLIGGDFPATTIPSSAAYSAAFRTRACQDDVREAIEFTGETSRVPEHLRRAGYILSSSIRESFHLGAVEGVAAGAVPVIRDWPVFAGRDAARRLFPADWVVETPEQAVDRIQACAADRAAVADLAGAEVQRRFDPVRAREALRRIILGEYAGVARHSEPD